MNNLKEIYEALNGTGIPTVYRAFPVGQAPDLPFIAYFETGASNFIADNRVYHSASDFEVQLYTDNREPATEERVELALSNYVWTKEITYLDDEKCYVIVYSFTS